VPNILRSCFVHWPAQAQHTPSMNQRANRCKVRAYSSKPRLTKGDMQCKHPFEGTGRATGPCFCRCHCCVSWLQQLLRIQSSAEDTGQKGQASTNKGVTRTRTCKHATSHYKHNTRAPIVTWLCETCRLVPSSIDYACRKWSRMARTDAPERAAGCPPTMPRGTAIQFCACLRRPCQRPGPLLAPSLPSSHPLHTVDFPQIAPEIFFIGCKPPHS